MATTESDASDWSDSDAAIDFACTEEALNPGLSGQTISLLSFERVGHAAASTDAAGDEEDVLLPELTGHPASGRKQTRTTKAALARRSASATQSGRRLEVLRSVCLWGTDLKFDWGQCHDEFSVQSWVYRG